MRLKKDTNFEVLRRMSADLDWESMLLGQKAIKIRPEKYNITAKSLSQMIRQANVSKYCERKLRIKSVPPEILVYAEMYDEK